jgi:FkbM family methyltransferase
MTSGLSPLARIFLRYGVPLAGLRRIPIVGPCLRWAGARMVPRNLLVWEQVRQGPAVGIWLCVNPRTKREVLEGKGETEVQRVLQEHVRRGMTFYDVGANIGFFSMLAARLVGSTGHVAAFEADPEIVSRLREHAKRNQFSWVSVNENAVWSERRTVLFARADPAISPDRGLGHVVDSPGKETISVDAVSLDDYALTASAPDFIKCDVEGAEVEVFRGAQRVLGEKQPLILCEMHGEENRRILSHEFSRLGYVSKDCGEHHVLALPR